MNRQSYLTLLLAFGCIIAVGTSATTLDSSLSTDPDDVIDIDYKYLPFGADTGATLKNAGQPNERGRNSASTASEGGNQGSDQSSNEASDDGSSSDGSSGEGGAGQSADAGPGQSAGAGAGSGQGYGAGTLQSLLDLLAKLIPLILLLIALALAYRYRDRLLALILAVDSWFWDRSDARRGGGEAPWPRRQPSNDIHRAWLAMVQRANPSNPRNRTPAEFARAAVDAGMDSDTVRTLTTLFEEVRYGGEPVTDERREVAREGLRRLDHPGGANAYSGGSTHGYGGGSTARFDGGSTPGYGSGSTGGSGDGSREGPDSGARSRRGSADTPRGSSGGRGESER